MSNTTTEQTTTDATEGETLGDVFEEYEQGEGQAVNEQEPAEEAPAEAPVEEAPAEEAKPAVFESGTWQRAMQRSAALFDRSTGDRKKASVLLWQGATSAIADWEDRSDVDVHAENLYADVLDILGAPRKGDASKIKTVALAVKNHGLVTSTFPNLSKAYAEATRLTKTVKQDKAEDDAAEKAVEALAADVPNSTTTVEGAALLLLSKGIDGAVVALLDALGKNNEAAHRSFIRAVSTEVASRVQAAKPKPAPKAPAAPKAGATKAKATPGTKAKAPAKTAAKTTATPAKKAVPTKAKVQPSTAKPDATKRALPVKKAVPVKR